MKRTISPASRQTVRSTHCCHDYDRAEVVKSTRRRKKDATLHRFQRGDLFVLLLSLIAASSDALLFKRGRVGHSGWSKGKNLGRDKVKEDVAWILEDTSEEGWKPVSDDGHVKVWKRSMPGSEFIAVKSSATLLVSPQSLFEVLTPGDIDIVRKYNPMVDDGTDLEVVDRDNKVSWSATMPIWPCRPRDFVTHIRRATLDDGSVAIVNSATTHPKAPGSARYVRGEILHGVFHIKPADDKKHSEFTMVHHFNPGGSVPAWLINWLAEGKPVSFVRRLEDVAKQWDARAAEYKKKHHRSMPCKGRGFADKPCAFLLSAKDVDLLPAPPRSWGSWLGEISRILALLMAALATAASVWYGWAAACRGWSQLWTDKDTSALSSRGNGHGNGGGRSNSNGTESNQGVGNGVDTPSTGVPSDQDATLDAKASVVEKSADMSIDESPTLGPCDQANGGAEGGQKKQGVDDDGEPVVAAKEDASGGVRDVYEPCVVPNDVPGPNGEVGD